MKTEWKVLVSLLALLLVMEGGVRAFETRLSKDLAHLRELPAIAQRLKDSDAYQVLIVGNSLARSGIDQGRLTGGLENKGFGQVQVVGFLQDATGITEWSYGLQRYFLDVGAIPDRIVLVTGRTHLLDSGVSPERLGAFYVGGPEVGEAIRTDLDSLESISRFFLARISKLFANRARIQPFAFYNYLPAYTQTVRDINDQRKRLVELARSQEEQRTAKLGRFLQAAKSRGIEVAVVAIPMLVRYDLPQAVIEEIGKQGVELWDLSKIDGIEANNFFDGYHLDAEGGRRVTDELIDRFSQDKH